MKPRIRLDWKDQNKQKQSKEYDNYNLAYKAKTWLQKNGAGYIEMTAILIKPKLDEKTQA